MKSGIKAGKASGAPDEETWQSHQGGCHAEVSVVGECCVVVPEDRFVWFATTFWPSRCKKCQGRPRSSGTLPKRA